MVTAQELLSYELKEIQKTQHILSMAETAAAFHKLKTDIRTQMEELDRLECQVQVLAAQRGWDVADMEPASRWMASIRFRCRKDPAIAEQLIRHYTQSSITLLKLYHRWSRDDDSIRSVFQKYMDCCTVGIRQMQSFL